MGKTQLTTPKIKKGVMKKRGKGRTAAGAKRTTAGRKQGASVKYDKIVTDNVKKLVWSIMYNLSTYRISMQNNINLINDYLGNLLNQSFITQMK